MLSGFNMTETVDKIHIIYKTVQGLGTSLLRYFIIYVLNVNLDSRNNGIKPSRQTILVMFSLLRYKYKWKWFIGKNFQNKAFSKKFECTFI